MPLSMELDLQDVIYRRLSTDPTITIPVFDRAPPQQAMPYISFGNSTDDEDDAECIVGIVVNFRVDVWVNGQQGMADLREYMGAVRRSLHKFKGEMTDNALHSIRYITSVVMDEPNGIDMHGQVEFECRVEEP